VVAPVDGQLYLSEMGASWFATVIGIEYWLLLRALGNPLGLERRDEAP
jgi:hypothetical protein